MTKYAMRYDAKVENKSCSNLNQHTRCWQLCFGFNVYAKCPSQASAAGVRERLYVPVQVFNLGCKIMTKYAMGYDVKVENKSCCNLNQHTRCWQLCFVQYYDFRQNAKRLRRWRAFVCTGFWTAKYDTHTHKSNYNSMRHKYVMRYDAKLVNKSCPNNPKIE